MDPEATVERLIDAGVLAEADGGESLQLGPDFREARAHHVEDATALDDESLAAELAAIADGGTVIPEDRRERIEMLASYRALRDQAEDVPAEHRLQLLPVVDRFSEPAPRDEGAPEAFVPVTGRQLSAHLRTGRAAIVYVWRDDCPPCDLTVEDLDAIFPEPPDDVALLAIDGPGYPDVMDEYDVVGAPTILFLLDGAVDVRLQGPQYREVIENELRKLREQR